MNGTFSNRAYTCSMSAFLEPADYLEKREGEGCLFPYAVSPAAPLFGGIHFEHGSVERYAQLFPEYGFDPFEIFFHEGEFFLDVGNAFEERIERSQKPLVVLVQLGEAPVDGAETVVDSVQNNGRLFRQQLLDLRDEGRFPGTTDGFWLWHE